MVRILAFAPLLLLAVSSAHAGEALSRGEQILLDPEVFEREYGSTLFTMLRGIVEKGQVAESLRSEAQPPRPTLQAIRRRYGPADHVAESENGTVYFYNRVGLFVARKTEAVSAVEIQFRDYARRTRALRGLTYDYDEKAGKRYRLFFRDGERIAGQVLVDDGAWKLQDGQIPAGTYRRHWDAGGTLARLEYAGGEGIERVYYDNGTLHQEVPFRNDRWHGISRYYYPSGQLQREIPVVAGRIEGKVVSYYPTGKPSSVIPYRHGVKHGLSKEFYPDGLPRWEIPYENGVVHGVSKEYFRIENMRRLKREMAFEKGNPHGFQREYYPSGQLKREQEFADGKPRGEPMEYDETGRPLESVELEEFPDEPVEFEEVDKPDEDDKPLPRRWLDKVNPFD